MRRMCWRQEQRPQTHFTNLFVGLGAISLLVGGIEIANVMVIAVIERRAEIGLRRALGPPVSTSPRNFRLNRYYFRVSGDHRIIVRNFCHSHASRFAGLVPGNPQDMR